MSVQMTEEQQLAVSSRGRVIVSASAGSGKTFVMIERLVPSRSPTRRRRRCASAFAPRF